MGPIPVKTNGAVQQLVECLWPKYKNDVKPADTNSAVVVPLSLQSWKQHAKLVTPQPSVTLRDSEGWQPD